MRPRIESTRFGSITVDGQKIDHDIVLRLDGSIQKRKKKLSKRVYGTSHTLSLDEVRDLYDEGANLLVVGTGQFNRVKLSKEAEIFLQERNCRTELAATPKAMLLWNEAEDKAIGLFHITC